MLIALFNMQEKIIQKHKWDFDEILPSIYIYIYMYPTLKNDGDIHFYSLSGMH